MDIKDLENGEDATCPIMCSEEVSEGALCDLCLYWHHRKCAKMPLSKFNVLSQNEDSDRHGVI